MGSPTSSNSNSGVSYKTLLLGAGLQVFEVSTLGQPFEVIKTHMAGKYQSILPAIEHSFLVLHSSFSHPFCLSLSV